MADQASTHNDGKTRVILLTGPVGSGKTSLLNALLELRPSEEKWSVLINDTGQTQVDASKNSSTNVEINIVYGACGASAKTGVPMRAAVLRALKKKPDCFLVELSTLAQPQALHELLSECSAVARVAVVAVVPWHRHGVLWESTASATYRAQLEHSDLLAVCANDGTEGIRRRTEREVPGKDLLVWGWDPSPGGTAAVVSLEQLARDLLLQQRTRGR